MHSEITPHPEDDVPEGEASDDRSSPRSRQHSDNELPSWNSWASLAATGEDEDTAASFNQSIEGERRERADDVPGDLAESTSSVKHVTLFEQPYLPEPKDSPSQIELYRGRGSDPDSDRSESVGEDDGAVFHVAADDYDANGGALDSVDLPGEVAEVDGYRSDQGHDLQCSYRITPDDLRSGDPQMVRVDESAVKQNDLELNDQVADVLKREDAGPYKFEDDEFEDDEFDHDVSGQVDFDDEFDHDDFLLDDLDIEDFDFADLDVEELDQPDLYVDHQPADELSADHQSFYSLSSGGSEPNDSFADDSSGGSSITDHLYVDDSHLEESDVDDLYADDPFAHTSPIPEGRIKDLWHSDGGGDDEIGTSGPYVERSGAEPEAVVDVTTDKVVQPVDSRYEESSSIRLSGDGFTPAKERVSGDGFASSERTDERIADPAEDEGRVVGYDEADYLDDAVPERLDRSADWSEEVEPPSKPVSPERKHSKEAGEAEFTALDLRDRVVIMLLFKQVVQIEDVENAWRRWQEQSAGNSREPLWRVLAMDPSFDREQIFAEAAQVYAFKEAHVVNAHALQFIAKHKEVFEEEIWERMRKLRVLPIRKEVKAQSKETRVIFISHDPSRTDVSRLMRELKLDSYEMQYAPESQIEALIAESFPKRNEFLDKVSSDEFAFDLGTSYDDAAPLVDEDALEAEISSSSLINLFEAALVEAVRRGVSDIHIFPNPKKQIEIHFRVDGELECWHREARINPEAFISVVKDNTLNVDRFERDSAQDGFIQREVDETLIRYRVSVLPVANANQELRSESIVIRVLDDRKVITDLGRLGLLDRARANFEWAISQPHGMVILTGPTGSGKTTTLFAALSQVVTPKLNVLTVEDPVEYVIPGVRQIKLSYKLVLEQALRSILRHDPDVVMVGEMRDRETAELAIKLANTGHLTFSTLHTNDAPSAVSRLYKMGIEPFLIAYAINLVVAQRLIRTLCTRCKRPHEVLDYELLSRLGFTQEEQTEAQFYKEGQNPHCKECGGTGYKGRRAITETMPFSHEIRRQIIRVDDMIDEDAIRELAEREGMLTLRASAREIVKQGETSIMELIRVTAGDH